MLRFRFPTSHSAQALRLTLTALFLLGLLLSLPSGLAWDNNWTQGRSGNGDVIYDPDSSHGDSGNPERPQKFLTPPVRDYADVDPDELNEYFKRRNKDYSPHALVRLSQDIHYAQVRIPKGYYQIEAAGPSHGSARANIQVTTGATQISDVIPALPHKKVKKQSPAQSSPPPDAHTIANPLATPPPVALDATGSPASEQISLPPLSPEQMDWAGLSQATSPTATPIPSPLPVIPKNTPRTLVFKRLGRVVAVLPIHRMEPYKPKRKEKIPKHALAWVETENRRPVLKFYHKKRLYTTVLQ